MTSSLTQYSVAEIRQSILDAFTIYKPGDSTAEGSDAWVEANALAIQLFRQQLRDVDIASWISVKYATGTKLDDLAAQWLPTPRQAATQWFGRVTFTATSGSTPTAAIGDLTATSESGLSYTNTEIIAAGDWSAGTVAVEVESDTTGTSNNQSNGTALTLNSTPAGFESSATLIVDANTILATDRESDEDLRARVFNATKNRPASGNWSHFKEWAEEVDGVDTAYIYPLMYGLGTVLVVPMGESGSLVTGAITASVIDKINEQGHRPVGTILYVKIPTPDAVEVFVHVKPEIGYEADWSGTNMITDWPTPPTTTNFLVAGTINFSVDDRIAVNIEDFVGNDIWEQVTVTSIVGNMVTVDPALSTAPLDGVAIWPGGPLWQPIHDAIVAEFAKLGPAKCIETTGDDSLRSPRLPYYNSNDGGDCTIWSSKLHEAIEAIPGTNGVLTLELDGSTIYGESAICLRGATTVPIKTLDLDIRITFA